MVTSALDGVRVVDLSTGIAGPLAAMLLGDFGADVVKVESPSGDPSRAVPGFAVWNRNKRGVVLTPGDPASTERLARWLAEADVCVTGASDGAGRDSAGRDSAGRESAGGDRVGGDLAAFGVDLAAV